MVVYIVIVSVHLQLEGYSLDIISILLQKVFLELIVSFLMCVIHDIVAYFEVYFTGVLSTARSLKSQVWQTY